MRLRNWAVIPFLVTIFSQLPNISQAADPLEPCRIKSTNTANHMRIGWPIDENTLKSVGESNILVLVVDFADAPREDLDIASFQNQMQLKTVASFYSSISNNNFSPNFVIYPKYVRMPKSSNSYGEKLEVDKLVDGEWESHRMTHDAIDAVPNSIQISDYDAAIVVVSGGVSLSGRIALATSQDEGIDLHESGEIHNTILVGIESFSIEGLEPWRIIAHEINHLLGIPDLYLYEFDGWWKGKSTGPFGVQGYLRGSSSSDSIGWNRWLRGWVPESRVLCITEVSELLQVKMSPSGSKDKNYELIVIRINSTQAIVVEALRPKGFEASTLDKSLLIYKVDASIESGFGPIRIIPKKTPITTAPLSPSLPDWERFQDAPLGPFQQVLHGDYLFRNSGHASGAINFSMFVGKSAVVQSDIKPRTIACKKGKIVLKVRGFSPTCPK